MKFLLILQWPATSIKDYDAMIEIEESIIRGLGNLGKVDGHDAGAGEMNIFIFTDDAQAAFEKIKSFIGTRDFIKDLKAAYRKVGGDFFTIIYPDGETRFSVA